MGIAPADAFRHAGEHKTGGSADPQNNWKSTFRSSLRRLHFCVWSVKPLQLVGNGFLWGCFKMWNSATGWTRKLLFEFFYFLFKEMYDVLCSLLWERSLGTRITSLPKHTNPRKLNSLTVVTLLCQTSWFMHLLCVAWVANTSIAWYHSSGLAILCMKQSFPQCITLSSRLFRERF